MQPRLAPALCCCLAVFGAAQAEADLSPETRAKILSGLPAYHPNPPEERKAEAASPVGEPAPLSDDPLVRLPRYYVQDSPLVRAGADALLSEKGREKEAMREYRASMSPLEWLLNSWHIPFITPSAQARANEAYTEKRLADEARRLADLQALPDH